MCDTSSQITLYIKVKIFEGHYFTFTILVYAVQYVYTARIQKKIILHFF